MKNNLPVQEIIRMYVDEKLSVCVIGEKFNVFPNTIRRILHRNGVHVRSKSEAQKLALDTKRAEHPTEGKQMPEDARLKISQARVEYWANAGDDVRKGFADRARERWESMDDDKRDEIQRLAGEGLRESAKFGSKIERAVYNVLVERGIDVVRHKVGMIDNEKFEVDLYLPKDNVAIEIDGPTHFLPIFGEEELNKVIKADLEKSGLLQSSGISVVRVKYLKKGFSAASARKIVDMVMDFIKEINRKKTVGKLKTTDMYIEVEA